MLAKQARRARQAATSVTRKETVTDEVPYHRDPGPAPMPPQQAVNTLQASKEWMKARIADGIVECHHVILGSGGFTVSNADSHEAVMDGLLEYPLPSFTTWKVKPLCGWSHGYNNFIELWRRLTK